MSSDEGRERLSCVIQECFPATGLIRHRVSATVRVCRPVADRPTSPRCARRCRPSAPSSHRRASYLILLSDGLPGTFQRPPSARNVPTAARAASARVLSTSFLRGRRSCRGGRGHRHSLAVFQDVQHLELSSRRGYLSLNRRRACLVSSTGDSCGAIAIADLKVERTTETEDSRHTGNAKLVSSPNNVIRNTA